MARFKRIYVEITNACNLSCSFCSKSKRDIKFMSLSDFEQVLININDYTDYIYLHVKGEPLLHPKLKEILFLAKKYNKKVNITTNGTLLKKMANIIIESEVVRQLNISLHSENDMDNYFEDIFSTSKRLTDKCILVYRFWTLNNYELDKKSTDIVDKIIKFYKISPEVVDKIKTEKNIEINKNIYINKSNQFIWPSLDNDYLEKEGFCYALKDQIAILSDGTVVPCCLDGEGIINLGDIYSQSMKEILSTEKVQKMMDGFRKRCVTEKLCEHCNFKDKF